MKRPKRLTDAGTLVTLGDLQLYHERYVVPLQRAVEALAPKPQPEPEVEVSTTRNHSLRTDESSLDGWRMMVTEDGPYIAPPGEPFRKLPND